MRRPRPRQLATLIAVAICLALPAADAIAQDSSSDPSAAQYDPPIPEGTEASSAAGSGSGLEANIGFLPFTGLDLLIVVGVALVLTGTGFALRRLATPRPPTG